MAPCQVFVDGQPVDTTFDAEHNTVRLTTGDWTRLEARDWPKAKRATKR